MTVPVVPVAVVGFACRFPGAPGAESFWRNLQEGTDTITRGPAVSGADGARRVAAYGALDDTCDFDWRFFGYNRADAARIDPQQRLFLQTASQALDHAAIDPARGEHVIAVIAGCDPPALIADQDETAWDKDFLCSRVAYKLNLNGPALTVQTACSTSLAAVHLACQSLRAGECDVALAGGVRVAPDPTGYRHVQGGVLSPDGFCRPFDTAAAGTVPAEGIGVVVLRLLNDALRDGHDISAVIHGSAVNNDGADRVGFTAPSVEGQREVISRAWKLSGVGPGVIGHVEAHGTGTALGDAVEVAALIEAFGGQTSGGPDGAGPLCGLGSVKGNIGHTGAASGVASLIKTVLMLRHRTLVPTAHFTEPNPRLRLDQSPFFVPTESRPWPRPPYAGVTSTGMGGTNVHVVLSGPPRHEQEPPGRHRTDRTSPAGPGPRVLCLSAHTSSALQRYCHEMGAALGGAAPSLADVAWTLAAGRREHPVRRAVVARTVEEARHRLDQAVTAVEAAADPELVLLFPGQGTWQPGFGRIARRLLPEVGAAAEHARESLRERFGLDLAELSGKENDTIAQQVNLFVLGYGLARQMQAWGFRPTAALGSSLGEYTAVTAAGLWTFDEGLDIVVHRAAAMAECPSGGMLAVDLPAHALQALDPELAVAIQDVGRTVVSGTREAIARCSERLRARGIAAVRLSTNLPFHSPVMRRTGPALERAVGAVVPGRPGFPVLSNLEGGVLDERRAAQPDYWADQSCQTVRLADNIGHLLSQERHTLFAELGPGTSLLGALYRHPAWGTQRRGVALLGRDARREELGVLEAVGTLWEHGGRVDVAALHGDRAPCRLLLPGPPFDALSCEETSDRPPDASGGRSQDARTSTNPEADPDPDTGPAQTLVAIWRESLGTDSVSEDDDYFSLGGDSLGLTRLVERVRERLDVNVPVSELSADARFVRLRELVDDLREAPPAHRPAATRRMSRGPVLLRRGGDTPLFFVPALTRGPMAYRRLADELEQWTCHGLTPPGSADAGRPATVEDLAAYYRDELARAASGPYLLAGWSLGAVVAHEMARQANPGHRPDRLLLIDGHPSPRRVPAALSPAHLVSAVPQWRELSGIARGGRPRNRQGTDGAAPLAEDPATARAALSDLRASLRHRPVPVPVPAVVLRAGLSPRRCRRLARALARLYPAGVQVRSWDGDHWSLLSQAGAAEIARLLRSAVSTSEETA
ncbi:beta-ketoacyl synthase N-terminal-like domain-containing protein [Actinomadura fulvescens]|uniref:Polyketide synthase n=1 Tax=Actinomadura fulvescens TaxID=46160 RepID=A0ABN3Q2C7_9ACTN